MSKDNPNKPSALDDIKNRFPVKKGALQALIDSARAGSQATVAPEQSARHQAPAVSPSTPAAPATNMPAPAVQIPASTSAPAATVAPTNQAPRLNIDSQTPVEFLMKMKYALDNYKVQFQLLTMIYIALRTHLLSGRKKNPNSNGIAENLIDYFGLDEQNLVKILQAVFAGSNAKLLKPKAVEIALRGDLRNMADFVYKEMFGLPINQPTATDKVEKLIDDTIGKYVGELPDLVDFNAETLDKILKVYQTVTILKNAITDKQINVATQIGQMKLTEEERSKILEMHQITKSKSEMSIDDEIDIAARIFKTGYQKHRDANGQLIKFDEQTIEQKIAQHIQNAPKP